MERGLRGNVGRLRRLQAVTDAALAHLEVEELLRVLLPRIRDILEADTCAVLLLDEETDELVARAAVGIEEEVEAGVRIPVGGGFAGRVAARKQPVILDDVDEAEVLNPILREKGIKSMLGVPLLVAGSVIGVLHVGTLERRRFEADDVDLLQLAADRSAVAIEHARLFEAERRARQRIEHVQAVTDAALAHLEVEELLEVLLPRIRDIFAADTCAVLLRDRQTDELVARAALGIEEEVVAGVRIPMGGGFAGRVAATKRPVIIDDLATAHVLNPILREKGIESMLGVPLLVADDAIGVMHVGSLVRRTFTKDDVELLELVAQRVAIAIERAQLHEQTRQFDQLKLNFVAIASHELRTPATSIYGALMTLVQRVDLPEETREELVMLAYEQSDRMRRLIEQLLDLSRLDSRAIRVAPRPIVLSSVLGGIVTGALPQGPPVEVDVPRDLAVVADPLVLERVVTNLLTNAVRHGAPPIRLSAICKDSSLRVSVEDAGRGVPVDLKDRLFDRFTRAEAGIGSGLGLAIARAYAQAMGGELFYREGSPGARFELIVPQEPTDR
ncbi:MAG TPA: GAF domain-containing protein [Gaiellaceae bacterium]|nr:GAF domain-containing protein [Gaiellaceae bacterium]